MRRGIRRDEGLRSGRGQSNVIAVVLLAGLVLAGATVVVVAGSTAINQAQGESSFATAEQSMRSFGAEIDSVSRTGEMERFSPQGLGEGDATIDESAGEITITIEKSGDSHSVSKDLGSITYEQDGRSLAYQSGGVFEKTGNGSVVVSSPPVGYQTANGDPTLNLGIVSVTGESIDGEVKLNRSNVSDLLARLDGDPTTDRGPPGHDDDKEENVNPLPRGATLTISVESEYYEGWGSVFEETVDATTNYDHADQRASLVMETPPEAVGGKVTGSVISPYGPTSEFANGPVIDSYSDTYSGPAPDNSNGNVYAQSMPIKNDGQIYGDLHVKSPPNRIQGNFKVHGEAVFGTYKNAHASPVQIDSGGGSKELEFFDDFHIDDWGKVDRAHFHEDVVTTTRIWFTDRSTVEGSVYSWARQGSNDVKLQGTVVEGNLYVIGTLHANKGAEVHGDIYYTDKISGKVNGKDGKKKDSSEIYKKSKSWMEDKMKAPEEPQLPKPDSVSDEIEDKKRAYDTDNDNAGADVSSNRLTCQKASVSSCTLTAGDYYLDKIDLDQNDELALDTTGGDIDIYVDGSVDLTKGNQLRITGDNRVNIYTGEGGGDTFKMTAGATVDNTDDSAKQLWVFMDPSDEAIFSNWGGGRPTTEFNGVIYGPGTTGNPGVDITVEKKSEIYGALVGNLQNVQSGSPKIHYDEALSGVGVFKKPKTTDSRVWYLRAGSETVSVS